MDWEKWHGGYRDHWALRMRLRMVQRAIKKGLDQIPPGPVHVLSICAGDGRDLAAAVRRNKRAQDMSAILIEINEGLVAEGRKTFERLGLNNQVEYRTADATDPGSYKGITGADILLACGMLGLVTPKSTPKLVTTLASLIKPGGQLIWTRSLVLRSGADHLEQFLGLLSDAGFEEKQLLTTPKPPFFLKSQDKGARFVVGVHEFRGKPPARPRGRLFQIEDL